MDVILFSFVALTSLICFFGTKIANWLSDEDSPVSIHTLKPRDVRRFYSHGYQAEPRQIRTFRYYSPDTVRLPLDRPQQSVIRRAA